MLQGRVTRWTSRDPSQTSTDVHSGTLENRAAHHHGLSIGRKFVRNRLALWALIFIEGEEPIAIIIGRLRKGDRNADADVSQRARVYETVRFWKTREGLRIPRFSCGRAS